MESRQIRQNDIESSHIHEPKEIYRLQIKDALSHLNGRMIVIWGTHELGRTVKLLVEELGYQVFCYISSRAQTNMCDGLPLHTPDILDVKKHYIIVTTSSVDVSLFLQRAGFKEDDDSDYFHISTIWHDDITYGGCFVGRGTYGYEFLHGASLGKVVKQIGRYCSINFSAKAVTNHPMSYVTTHGMLYSRYYIPASEKIYSITNDTPRGAIRRAI